jgi:glycosyltransferase involved in cell wall biosynthesis
MSVPQTHSPIVSVCMASFNHAPYVAAAVQSVLDQTFSDFELIIVDDGSSDDTLSILKKFDDHRIRLEAFTTNRSACIAANHAIKMSRGLYVSAISSDDIWEPFKLERQVEFLNAHPDVVATFSRATIVNQHSAEVDATDASIDRVSRFYLTVFNVENRSKVEWLEKFFFDGNCLCHSSILIRHRFLIDHGAFNPSLCQLPDFDLWIRLVQHGEIHVATEPLVRFRVLPENKNASGLGKKKPRIFSETVFVYTQFFEISVSTYIQPLLDRLTELAAPKDVDIRADLPIGLQLAMVTARHHPQPAARVSAINFIRSRAQVTGCPEIVLCLHNLELANDSYNFVALDEANSALESIKAEASRFKQELLEATVAVEKHRAEADQSRARSELFRQESIHYQKTLDEVLQSRLWRSTAFLRGFIDRLKHLTALFPSGYQKDSAVSTISQVPNGRRRSYSSSALILNGFRRVVRKVRSLSVRYVYPVAPGLHSLVFFRLRRTLIAILGKGSPGGLLSLQQIFFADPYAPSQINANPLVSIIVPCFNHASYLEQRLSSINQQTYSNVELILLDDASEDGSVEMLRRFVNQHPENTSLVVNSANSGSPFSQWKRGLAAAKGDLIWIAESDDFCDPNFLAELVPLFSNQAVMLAFCRTVFVDASGDREVWSMHDYIPEISAKTWDKPFLVSTHKLAERIWSRRNLIPNVSAALFRPPAKLPFLEDPEWIQMRVCGDWFFYLHLACGGLVAYSPRTTSFYRQHPTNSSVALHRHQSYLTEHLFLAERLLRLMSLRRADCLAMQTELEQRWMERRNDTLPDELKRRIKALRPLSALEGGKTPALLIVTYALIPGGGEIMPLRLANTLRARGFPISVLNCHQQPSQPGVRSMLNSNIPLFELSSLEALPRLVSDLRIDVIHSHHPWVDTTIAELFSGRSSVSHVVTSHGMYDELDRMELARAGSLLSPWVKHCTYVADKNRQPLLSKISNSVDDVSICPENRRELGIGDHDFVICLASRAIRAKGWQEAIEVLELVQERSERRVHLLLIGEGREADRLKRNTRVNGVHFLGFRPNIRGFYACSDIGILPTSYPGESQPLTLIECLSAGRPFIASDLGEIRSMLSATSGELAGAAIPLQDGAVSCQMFADTIALYLAYPDVHAHHCSLAVNAAKKFNPDAMAEAFETVYRHALSSGSKGSAPLELSKEASLTL